MKIQVGLRETLEFKKADKTLVILRILEKRKKKKKTRRKTHNRTIPLPKVVVKPTKYEELQKS